MGVINLSINPDGTYRLSDPRCRFASYDLCYGYFQTHRGKLTGVNMEKSCLHLWSYLASWGMLRGSSKLLSDCSMKVMEDVVNYLSTLKNPDDWELDLGLNAAGAPDPVKSKRIIEIYKDLSEILGDISVNDVKVGVSPTPTLVTKIMLGTLGCVPALDRYFRKVVKIGLSQLNQDVLSKIQDLHSKPHFYVNTNKVANIAPGVATGNDIDASVNINIDIDIDTNTKIRVIDFSGKVTNLLYPRAKVFDMIGFSISAGWTWQII